MFGVYNYRLIRAMKKGVRINNPQPNRTKFTSRERVDEYLRKNWAEMRPDGSVFMFFDRMHQPKPDEPIERIRQIGNRGSGTARLIRPRTGPTPEELHWRTSVLVRDGHKCVSCGSTDRLEADHIQPKAIYPDLKYSIDNGRTLCHACHVQTPTYGGKVKRLVSVSVE